MKSRERRIEGEVTEEKDKYTNDTARRAEVFARLQKDKLYIDLINMVGATEDAIERDTAVMDIAKMNIRVWDILTRDYEVQP